MYSMPTEVQSVVFDRPQWNLERARKWITEHNYKVNFKGKPPDVKATQLRFRQTYPGYPSYRTKKLGDGIMLVFGLK